MNRIHPGTLELGIDRVRQIVADVEEGGDPLLAAQIIVAQQIETDFGPQPRYLLGGGAVKRNGIEPGVPMTTRSPDGTFGLRAWLPTARGGGVHVVRATGSPELGLWSVISDPNITLERTKEGGLGVNDSYDLGVAGWSGLQRRIHPNVWRAIETDPSVVVGHLRVIENDGSFVPVGLDTETEQYVSAKPSGHEAVATFPIIGAALLQLPGVVDRDILNYAVRT